MNEIKPRNNNRLSNIVLTDDIVNYKINMLSCNLESGDADRTQSSNASSIQCQTCIDLDIESVIEGVELTSEYIRCKGEKRKGGRCSRKAKKGEYCEMHKGMRVSIELLREGGVYVYRSKGELYDVEEIKRSIESVHG